MTYVDKNVIERNRIHYDRVHKIPENRDKIIQYISKESGIAYEKIVLKLPEYIRRLSLKQSIFMKDIIFREVPLVDISHTYHMSLEKTAHYYEKTIDTLINIIKGEMVNG